MKRNLQSAFTLLEILLAIALIALIATALIAGSVNLLKDKPSSPDEVFWQAAAQARRAALQEGNPVLLSFDDDKKAFIVDDGTTQHPVPVPAVAKDFSVEFIAAQSNGGDMMLIAGTMVDNQPIPAVTFYSDGTCSPFRVQFRAAGGAHILSIDPWTCSAMLKPLPATP